ncbi:DUF4240 domain-containing protein [Mucilaginibacter auburnensis]|uniref:Uncharacterized protein DUF4240 n=1 Tax=Mucilaginibacter auburnensis TaxID=1457233 RepID=A0A2H9VPM3_9SPHI|nr:DUF4240 domain-containing protein [Mucilaginibacter auburnensis]PJJ80276.1 uncharacterized protein DUF4240 [Mucilaginibacter auburnensis]
MRGFLTIALFVILSVNLSCVPVNDAESFKPAVDFTAADKLDEREFWKIIDYSHNAAKGNLDLQNEIIIKKLSAYEPAEIINFEVILCKKLIEANSYKVLAANTIMDGGASDDGFLYYRLWLISLGETTFKQTLKNPEYLAALIKKGVVPDFEALLYVSTEAYKNKTGKQKEDDSFPRGVAFAQGLNYDFGGPKIVGTEWREEDLPKLYPKLWKKFN